MLTHNINYHIMPIKYVAMIFSSLNHVPYQACCGAVNDGHCTVT